MPQSLDSIVMIITYANLNDHIYIVVTVGGAEVMIVDVCFLL